MEATPAVLLKGAWYALEQSGNLLRDAIVLYRAKAYSSAVALASGGQHKIPERFPPLKQLKRRRETTSISTDGA